MNLIQEMFFGQNIKRNKIDQKSSIKDDNSNLYNLSKFIYY